MIKHPTRRALLGYGLGSAFLAACGNRSNTRARDAHIVTPTPTVIDDDDHDAGADAVCFEPTADNIEGPYYKAGAPHNAVLITDKDPGDRVVLGGLVMGTGCRPLADVELDVWHADAAGGYDTEGYHLRGKLVSDADGRWKVDSIIPGRYLNGRQYRPAHVHFKLRAAGHKELTTQLYFDGDPYNDVDPFIHKSLIMPVESAAVGSRCRFDFVLEEA